MHVGQKEETEDMENPIVTWDFRDTDAMPIQKCIYNLILSSSSTLKPWPKDQESINFSSGVEIEAFRREKERATP